MEVPSFYVLDTQFQIGGVWGGAEFFSTSSCESIQVNFDTMYLQIVSNPTG